MYTGRRERAGVDNWTKLDSELEESRLRSPRGIIVTPRGSGNFQPPSVCVWLAKSFRSSETFKLAKGGTKRGNAD